MTQHPAIQAGRVAVVMGSASGIGLAAAKHFAKAGLKVCMADANADLLTASAAAVAALAPGGADDVLAAPVDVSEMAQVAAFKDQVYDAFGEVAVLMNNAGIGRGGGAFDHYERWQRLMAVNLWGVINGVHAFTEAMIAQGTDAAIINTGSKQGITNPPGDAAYNVTKAGIKSATESLAYQLSNIEGCRVSAHLLVPGFTYTGISAQRPEGKPAAAWTSEQVVDEMLAGLSRGDFYILCPDNDVTRAMDEKRIQWAADDLIKNRPALSRWRLAFKDEFAAWMASDS
jgi:NAD(P)-dependent dehydrogenase (short-subunit alcohol dehydrogenase family)